MPTTFSAERQQTRGMIDIHTHVLPGIDDGAADMPQAQSMLRLAASSGTTDIVATPHANMRYRFDAGRARQCLAEVAAAAEPGMPRLHLGCELHLTYDNVLACLAAPQDYTLAGGSWLLLELPDDKLPESAREIIGSIVNAGLRPIITHPERTRSVRGRLDVLRGFAELGCVFQITAGSLEGQFGRSMQAGVHDLLRDGLVQLIASDAHDDVYRRPMMTGAFERLLAEYGEERAVALCRDNPQAVIENRDLPARGTPPPRRKWFHFARWGRPWSAAG
jgi:protein-tyrosine phosphatase